MGIEQFKRREWRLKKLLIVTIWTLLCSIYFQTDCQVATDLDVGPMEDHSSKIENI